jgi:DnaJ-class molecular chaperone
MYRPIQKLESGFYSSFETLAESQAKQALLEAWSTEEQRAYNASTAQCASCKGWGYRIIRKGRETIREKAGCPDCLGLGKIPKRYEEVKVA